MNYIKLKAELDSNVPLYGGLTDTQAATELNVVDKVSAIDIYSGSELFGLSDATEYNVLTPAKKDEWLSLCNIASLNSNAVVIADSIYGNASNTVANIPTTKTQSRATVIGVGAVQSNDITIARAH